MRRPNWGVITAIVVAIVVAVAVGSCGPGWRDRDAGLDASASAAATPAAPAAPWQQSAEPCALPGGHADGCEVAGYPDRPFSVFVPSAYDPAGAALPVVLFLHGGGGNAEQTQATTCPRGRTDDAGCLHGLGEAEGFITVYPNGTPSRLLPRLRTWNAGGGGDYECLAGRACAVEADDVAYIGAVLDAVAAQYRVDASRVYVMGFSNGAAMSHRLGCEMADRIAAIAPVAGSHQFSTAAPCAPSAPMPVVYAHGTADACWRYEESDAACLSDSSGLRLGAREGIEVWADVNGCEGEPAVSRLDDHDPDDGTLTVVTTYTGCDGGVEVRLLTVDGGGHAFPGGDPRTPGLGAGGESPRDWDVSLLWEFLSSYLR